MLHAILSGPKENLFDFLIRDWRKSFHEKRVFQVKWLQTYSLHDG